MTSRAALLILLIFLCTLAGLATRQGAVLALVLPLLVYLGMAAWNRPTEVQLTAERQLDRRQSWPETPINSLITVRNQDQSNIEELEIEEALPEGMHSPSGHVVLTTFLGSGEQIEVSRTLLAPRGEYHLNDLQVVSKETFALFELRRLVPAPGRIEILPTTQRMRPVPIRPPQTRGFAGPIPSRQGGAGVEFLLVREYQPGDPLRQVNWKVSARAEREIYTTNYEIQRIADVGIILDARQTIDVYNGKERLFEHSVRAAGNLADLFLQDGNRVGLLVYGAAIVSAFPGTGKIQRERILQVLAKAQTGFSYALEKFDYLPTRFFPPKSQIVLVSPLIAHDIPVLGYLRRQGYAILVVSPNAVLFETDPASDAGVDYLARRTALVERSLHINALRRLGLQVVDWDVSAPLEPLVRAAVMSSVRQLLPGER